MQNKFHATQEVYANNKLNIVRLKIKQSFEKPAVLYMFKTLQFTSFSFSKNK